MSDNIDITIPSSLQIAEQVMINSLGSRTNEDWFNMDLYLKAEHPNGFTGIS